MVKKSLKSVVFGIGFIIKMFGIIMEVNCPTLKSMETTFNKNYKNIDISDVKHPIKYVRKDTIIIIKPDTLRPLWKEDYLQKANYQF